jgi:hypothetical protein
MYVKDNTNLLKEINILFESDDLFTSVEYGLKSSAGISTTSPSDYGTNNNDNEWYIFDKHKDESLEYIPDSVIGGKRINRKSIVAVFRNNEGKKILEVTLGCLNSPLTLA